MSKVNAQILASDTIFLSVLQLAERFPSGNLLSLSACGCEAPIYF